MTATTSQARRGAGLLIVRPKDEKILLVKRAADLRSPGHWGVPGGHMEPGETEAETALREGIEELGGLPLLEVHAATEPSWHAPGPFFAFATFLAVLAEEDWEPRLNLENVDWGWFDPGRLPSPLMPGTRKALKDLLGR
jgi:8-oxo-dGTP diphosphatase